MGWTGIQYSVFRAGMAAAVIHVCLSRMSLVEGPNWALFALGLPGAILAQTGAAYDLVTGGGTVPRIRFAFDPSPSASVTEYWWQWRIHDEDWQDGGAISTTTKPSSMK